MSANRPSPLDTLRVRVNVTCAGTLRALNERGAVVQLPTPQRPQRQTTLAIEDERGETVYIPARVVRTEMHTPQTVEAQEHHVAMEFFGMSLQTAAAVRRLIAQHDARYERVA